jgi:hypothetical protein
MAARGEFNWGALERKRLADGTCPPGTDAGSDQGAVCFFVRSTDVDAAADFVKLLTKSHWPVLQAMNGSPEDVATAMRVPPPYYTGVSGGEQDRINAYARAIRNSIAQIGAQVPSGTSSTSSSSDPLRTFFILGAGVLGAYWLFHRYGFPRWMPKALRV